MKSKAGNDNIRVKQTVPLYLKHVAIFRDKHQGRRNGFGIGGGGGAKKGFFILHLHIKRIQFCSLVYLWFPKFNELSVYFILLYIHLFLCHYF